jgi:adenylate cyclase
MDAVFLHETEAAVVVFDLRGYSRLSANLPPLEIGLALGRYYRHVESCVDAWGGRLVKLVGDAVLAAWLANETAWPRTAAIAAVAESRKRKPGWLEKNAREGLPVLDYTAAMAVGPVLAGQLGTDRFKHFDVLGDPVNVAFKLTSVASAREVDHLLSTTVQDYPAIETEGVELGGKQLRLFRLKDAPGT